MATHCRVCRRDVGSALCAACAPFWHLASVVKPAADEETMNGLAALLRLRARPVTPFMETT